MISCGYVTRRTGVAAVALAAGTMFTGGAHAAGFALMEQNASGLGNAYAGQAAAAEDASTIFFNPAGMTFLPGRQVVVGGNFIRPRTEFNDDGSTVPLLNQSPAGNNGGDGGDAGDLAFVPHGYVSWEVVPSTVWVGLGVGAPFGLKTDYDDSWIGRFHGTKSEVKTVNINPSIAWKASETISIGAGLNFQKFDAELANAVSYSSAIFDATGGTVVMPGLEGDATVEGDDWGWGWNAGILINLSPSTRIGIAYRSEIEYKLKGDVDFTDRPPILAGNPLVANGDIEADVDLPQSLSIGVSHQLTPQLQLLADYTWTGWDSIQDIVIERDTGVELTRLELDMHNSWRAGIGLNYRLNDAWKLRGGVAYDRAAIRHQRTPRLPDEDRLWFAVGAQWALSKAAAIDFAYAYVTARGDASINLTDDPGRGNLVGDYDAKVHIVGVQARYSF